MKTRIVFSILILFLSASALSMLPGRVARLSVHGQPGPARIEVWDPDLHSSNITDLSLTPGNFFTALVNVTGAGQLGAFDVSLNYNLTQGPNVLNVASATLNGGLLDPRPGHAPAGCSVLVVKNGEINIPGHVRFAATFVGGCFVDATNGILFTMIFQVVGTGAGSIDLIQSAGSGRTGSTLVGENASENSTIIPYIIPDIVYGAYFKNALGIPPVAAFTYNPSAPVKGDSVKFNATASYDPENPIAPNHGLQAEPVVYDVRGNRRYDTGDTGIYLPGGPPASGTALSRDLNLLFVDTNHNNVWDSGEPVLYDTDNSLSYTLGDLLVYGSLPQLGASLSTDTNIVYVDIHQNSLWDNGYVWDYQDGSPLSPGNVTLHVFGNAATLSQGKFPVKLVVYDSDTGLPMRIIEEVYVSPGRIDSVAISATVDKPLVIIGDPITVNVDLQNTGNTAESVNLNVTLSLNGGTPIASETGIPMPVGSEVTKDYTIQTVSIAPGAYFVNAQATLYDTVSGLPVPNSDLRQGFASANFVVRASGLSKAVFTFVPANPVVGGEVFFDGTASSSPSGFIVSWSWSFGDGSTAFGPTIQHSYNSPGNYTVTLTVTDNTNGPASTTQIVPVRPRPQDDVSIVEVNAYPQKVISSQQVNILVIVENDGSNDETVSVSAYYGSNLIDTINGILVRANCNFCYDNGRVQILWDTSGVVPGNYTISATVSLPGDPTPADNMLSDGKVQVLPPPTLSANPSSGPPGTTVLLHGSGFPVIPYYPNSIEVTFDDQLIGLTNSHNGAFNFTFSIPLSQAGTHLIKALDEFSGARASVPFQVVATQSPGNLALTLQVGTIYFPSDTVVIYSQVTLNGQATSASLLLQLYLPNGSSRILTSQSIGPGLYKATFLVSKNGPTGTYLLVGTAHTNAPLGASTIASFEVKQSWLNGNASKITAGVAGAAILGLAVVAWQKGYFRKKHDETISF